MMNHVSGAVRSYAPFRRSSSAFLSSALALLLGLQGCAGIPRSPERFRVDALKTRCGTPSVIQLAQLPQHPPVQRRAEEPAGAEEFTPQAREIADVVNVLDLLKELPLIEADAARHPESAWAFLWTHQQVMDRIALASFDVSSTVAEIDCEEARADHVGDGLSELRQERQERGLFLALVGDALIGVVAGALSLAGKSTAAAANAILGGVVATGVGGAATIFLGGEHEFQHPRNHLRELWEGPDQSDLFPTSVWRYLNGPSETLPGRTVREALLERWRQEGRFGKPGSETERNRIALLFGDGGVYEIKALRIRAEMLNHLKSEVLRMGQDLNRLLYEIFEREPTDPLISKANRH